MPMAEEIRSRLEGAFQPSTLAVHDDSEQHRGHGGYQEGGESHWRVEIASPAFSDMSRIQRHRAIHAALGPEIIGRIHALQLHVSE